MTTRQRALPFFLTLLFACTAGAGSPTPSVGASGPSASSATGTGIISGELVAVGGPVSSPRPLPGAVEITGGGHDFTLHIAGTADGGFSVAVPPGTYSVRGRSPLYESGETDCLPTPPTATVTMGDTITVDVVCVEK